MAQEGNGSLFVFMEGDYKSAQLHCMVFQVILHIKLFRVCGKCKQVISQDCITKWTRIHIAILVIITSLKVLHSGFAFIKNVVLLFKYEEVFTTLYPDTSH